MMLREWILGLVVLVIGSPTVFGQCAGGWRPRPTTRPAIVFRPICAAPAAYAAPVVPHWSQTVYAGPTYVVHQTVGANDAGAFLARLNAWRARHGRHPIGWDATLAAYAASNSWAGHQPGSTGGAAQCWASHRSLVAALDAWIASPAHASILLNASVAVGASPCPSGSTCNAR